MDSEGNTSEPSTQTISKDTKAPTAVSLSVTSYDKTSISVTASGSDEGSGIISYAFQISQTENDEDFTTVRTEASTEGTCSYTYSNLEVGKNYYIRVIVSDRAGYQTTSEITKQGTQDNGLPTEELKASIGEYIDYTPVSGSFTSQGTYNGSSNKSFSTITSLKWRIMFVDDTTITLISDTTANTGFYLSGANGYNNGVKLLDDACKAMYSNSSLSAVGRSLKIRDIEEVSAYNKNGYSNYGREYSPSNTYYPNIFADELTGSVNEIYGKDLDLSDQTNYVTGTSHATTLKGKWTYYSYNMTSSNVGATYYSMFVPENSTTYWLASRCVYYADNDWFEFRMFYVSGGTVGAGGLYDSDDYIRSGSYAVRPVVEIDRSSVTIGETGSGTATSPFSIVAK